jgi:hypothetical protein
MCDADYGAILFTASSPNIVQLINTGYTLAGNDFMGGRPIFLAKYGEELAKATQVSLASPPKACFNCFMKHGYAKYTCDKGGIDCATVESDFASCLTATIKPLDVKISQELIPKCDAAEYAALSEILKRLDVSTIILGTSSVMGVFEAVKEAISASAGGVYINPYENRRCYACHTTRILGLYAAVKGVSPVCPAGISEQSPACVAKIKEIDGSFDECIENAVDGQAQVVGTTTTPHASAADSVCVSVTLLAAVALAVLS